MAARPANRAHKLAAAASGAVGGALGLAALPVELPISTTILLRSIAEIARDEGEDLSAPASALACVEVFALGGRTDEEAAFEGGYFAVRAALAKSVSDSARFVASEGISAHSAPIIARLISQIAARFGVVVSEKVAAQAAPILGAVGGATVNAAFADHFQTLARGHFIIRRLERKARREPDRVRISALARRAPGRPKSRVVRLEERVAPMGDGRPSPRKRRPWPVARALMLALSRSARGERAGAGRPEAAGPAARRAADALCARRERRPRMRAQLPGMAFGRGPDRGRARRPSSLKAVESLGGRRLPILIHSPGGSVADAMAMGELIRAKGLAVAVARTLITNCPERAPRCPSGPGRAMTGGAMCASACVLVLAGGVERLVGPAPRVGVHQITTLVKETEGSAHLTSTRKIYEQAGVDEAVTHYLTAMGVGDPVMALMRKTPAASIRWLSLADLRASGLATRALDAAEPIATSGANGLNAPGVRRRAADRHSCRRASPSRSADRARRSISRCAIAAAAARSRRRRPRAIPGRGWPPIRRLWAGA